MTDQDESFAARFAAKWASIKTASASLVGLSIAERLSLCDDADREKIMVTLGPIDWQRMIYDWKVWARPKQLAPSWEWDVWDTIGGRGSGKTRCKSEWLAERIQIGAAHEFILAGPTFGEIRKIMVGGYERRCDGMNGSGLLDVMPPWVEYKINEARGELHFPQFHSRGYFISAEKPDFVGFNPDTIWADEIIKWAKPEKLLEHIFLSNRKRGPKRPQMVISTTPRPLQFLRELILDEGTATTHATTWENRTNLARAFISRQERTLAGTRLGLQELEAELLGDNPDALFSMTAIDTHRVLECPQLDRIGVAIDPAVSTHRRSDDTGLICAGRFGDARSGHLFVLGDMTGRYQFEKWAEAAFDLLEANNGSFFVAERNRVGDGALATLRLVGQSRGYKLIQKRSGSGQDLMSPKGVRVELLDILAMGDKATRAEPLSALYQKGRIHHVGRLARLEDEQTEWNPKHGASPNGLDALVHVANELLDLGAVDVDHSVGVEGYAGLVGKLTGATKSSEPAKGLEALLGQLTRGHWNSRL